MEGTRKVSFKELKQFNHEFFFKQFRMIPKKLKNLLAMAAGLKIMRSSLRREAIGPREKLYVTLR